MPEIIEVTAKLSEAKGGAEGKVNYDFGSDLPEMTEKFGENVTFSNARSQMKIGLQAAIRRRLEAGQPIDDLEDNWKPGVAIKGIVDNIAAAKAAYAKMSKEDRAKFLNNLRSIE